MHVDHILFYIHNVKLIILLLYQKVPNLTQLHKSFPLFKVLYDVQRIDVIKYWLLSSLCSLHLYVNYHKIYIILGPSLREFRFIKFSLRFRIISKYYLIKFKKKTRKIMQLNSINLNFVLKSFHETAKNSITECGGYNMTSHRI